MLEIVAKMIQPHASFTAAAEIVTVPIKVRVMFNSSMMRASTGIAVIDIEIPMNSVNPRNDTG